MFRSLYLHSSGRRRGQALLLAVLVMVFAALIGVTFITVVAINIGQTGREEERDKARQAAQAGLAFANFQLTTGITGTRWRPEQEVQSLLPTPARSGPPPGNNPFYWTPFEQSQGWAGYNGSCDDATGACEGNFVKFPDPRSVTPSFSAPNYLMKVEKVRAADADNTLKDKTGMLRITSIGLSPEDPTSFYKIVTYKPGPAQQPLTGAMRSVSNWDFQNNVVPSALTASGGSTSATATTTMTLKDVNGSFANKKNFYVMISSATGTNVRYAVVAAANATGTVLTLAPTPDPTTTPPASGPAAPTLTWTGDERVELAAGLGAPSAVDFNNNNLLTDVNDEKVDFHVSKANTPGSARVNGGLVLHGNSFLQNLLAPNLSTNTAPPGMVKVSGLISVNASSTSTVAGKLADGTDTGARTLTSSDGAFPFNGTEALEQKLSVVEDGSNRIANSPDPTRQVKPFVPPSITAGGEGFGRYRQLSKYSPTAASVVSGPTTPSTLPQASAYGYGQGIYINNAQDVERANETTPMTQAQLQSLWFDSLGTSDEFLRSGVPLAATTAGSLEQQHLRGWIAPDEFLPRGALIEINPDATITITLDSITDGVGTIPGTGQRFNEGPVPDKSWREPNGALSGFSTFGGVYRRTFTWPENGVIFAEGNIRIRGKATTNDPDRNLTVVSMNNIYIEDSLRAGNKKVVLLARRNVVVNPTRVVGRPQAQTRALASSASANITVQDGSLFSPGDRITIGNTSHLVSNVSGNNLTVAPALTVAPTDTTVVALQTDPINPATPARPFFNRQTPYLQTAAQAMQRRFWVDNNAAVRIAMRHGAAEQNAFSLGVAGTDPGNLKLGNKMAETIPPSTPAPLQVADADKILTVEGDTGGEFPADRANDSIEDLVDQMNSRYDISDVPPDPWEYNANVLGGYGPVPYRYLAGIGLRHKVPTPAVPELFPFRQLLDDTALEFPIATSVKLLLNGVDDGVNNLVQLEDGAGGYSTVKQFGFAPTAADAEDALTVDRTFYNTFTSGADGNINNVARLATDSRRITGALTYRYNTLTWRFHDDAVASFDDAASRPLPAYSVDRAKLENLDQYQTSGDFAFETLDFGYELDINAYVYAQEGSWFVIPGVYFDERLKTTTAGSYIDYNNDNVVDPGEYLDIDIPGNTVGVLDPGEGPDLNRDGVYSRSEQISVYRFLRYNYRIKFTGAIMENNTALIEDPDGTGPQRGPATDWTDKWATVRIVQNTDLNGDGNPENNWSGVSKTSAFSNNLKTSEGNFTTIEYNFDPSAALETLVTNEGFHPPVTPELIYQTG